MTSASQGAPPAPPAGHSDSSIYDLGYRRYEGARLGRRHAVVALYLESLRGAFGLGRSAAAKVAPAVLIAIAISPAIVALVVGAVTMVEGGDFLPAAEYYGIIKYVLALYCAAVAPDIAGRDQRNRSLTLYFSRAVSRTDYAIAKFAAMLSAMLAVTLVPQLVLFIGNALGTTDFGGYVAEHWSDVFPIFGSALLGSALIASIGIAVAAQTPQRAFATVGIVIAFVLPFVIAGILVHEIGIEVLNYAAFLSPLDVLDGLTAWMFDTAEPTPDTTIGQAGHALWLYVAVACALTLVAVLSLVRRYRTVQA